MNVTGLSVGLFAPGWVYEGQGTCQSWRQVDEELWSSLAAVLGSGRALARRLPFRTTFNVGAGCATWHKVGQPRTSSVYCCALSVQQKSLRPIMAASLRVCRLTLSIHRHRRVQGTRRLHSGTLLWIAG